MAQLNIATLSDLVANKEIIWQREADSLTNLIRNSGLYNVDAWGDGQGTVREYSEMDGQEYATVKDESDDAETALVQQGYSKTVSPLRFGKDISISYELRKHGKYTAINRKMTDLARQTINRMDLDATHRLTFGTATTYTDMDGVSRNISTGDALQLFYSLHTLKDGNTYRNRLANNPRLSKGALENMEQMKVENTKNHFNEKMTMDFDILFTTDDPNTVNTARELLQSSAEISAPNAGVVNVYRGKYRHVVLPRLATTAAGAVDTDKRYYWGIASSRASDGYLSIAEEPHIETPTMGSNADEFSTDDYYFKGRGSWAICWTGGRSTGMSSGDGAA